MEAQAVVLNTNLIWNGKIHQKGRVFVVGVDVTPEEAERLLRIGKEVSIYDQNNGEETQQGAEDVQRQEGRKEMNAKQMKEVLKARGIRVPFGASKDILNQLCKENGI